MELNVQGQPKTSKVKLLGVTVEEGYTFNAHAKQVAVSVKSKVVKLSNMVSRICATQIPEAMFEIRQSQVHGASGWPQVSLVAQEYPRRACLICAMQVFND